LKVFGDGELYPCALLQEHFIQLRRDISFLLYFNIAVVFFLKSRRDGVNKGIFEETEQSFPGARLWDYQSFLK